MPLVQAYSEDKVPTSGGLEDALGSLCHIISSLPPAAAGAAGTTADGACTDGTDADGTKDRAPSSSSTGDAQGAAAVETQTGDPEGDGASSTSRSRAVVKEMSRLVSASVKWAQNYSAMGTRVGAVQEEVPYQISVQCEAQVGSCLEAATLAPA
eukprot:1139440-Pelagomonas_calceolata.AAC.2